MNKLPNIDKLNEAIAVAEKVLEDIENEDTIRANRKRKRVTNALEHAYATLNLKEYTENEVKARTDEIWKALVDDDPIAMFFLFLVGFSLSGALIFTVYQAYSFLESHLDKVAESEYPVLTEEITSKVKVEYKENNIVSLYDQMSVKDSVGLQNKPQSFTITNRSIDIGKINYKVKYEIFIEPLNDPKAHLLKEEHIKLKYTYTDQDGVLRESEIMTLADLPKTSDGTMLLNRGEQSKDSHTDYDVYFWISDHAQDDEQGATYTLKFKVDASVG